MADTSHSYILLRDKSILRDKSRHYPRGTLLGLNDDGSYKEHSHARYTLLVPPIRCDNDGDVAPLSKVESYLLVVWRSHTHNAQNRERVWCHIILRLVPVKKSDKRMNIIK